MKSRFSLFVILGLFAASFSGCATRAIQEVFYADGGRESLEKTSTRTAKNGTKYIKTRAFTYYPNGQLKAKSLTHGSVTFGCGLVHSSWTKRFAADGTYLGKEESGMRKRGKYGGKRSH